MGHRQTSAVKADATAGRLLAQGMFSVVDEKIRVINQPWGASAAVDTLVCRGFGHIRGSVASVMKLVLRWRRLQR